MCHSLVLSEDPFCLEVKVTIEDNDNDSQGKPILLVLVSRDDHVITTVSVDVRFTLPVNYPDEVPEITITTGSGLEAGEMREMERLLTQQVQKEPC